jgi:thiol-disulfide isomerase/thioredoxin
MKILAIYRTLALLLASVTMSGAALAWDPEIGDMPKPITNYEYLDGKPIELAEFIGHPLVIYFGADWCEPCVTRGRPATLAMYEKYKSKGVKVLFVSLDDNKYRPNKIRESQSLGIPFAMVKLDICPAGKCASGTRGDIGRFGRIYSYPTAIVLNAEGKVTDRLDRGQGVASGLDSAVQKLLK